MDNSRLIVDALLQTDPVLYRAIDAQNSWLTALTKRGRRVKLYREYDEGDHRADMTNQMRAMLRLKADEAGLNDFNDNYCAIVVDKMAGRLSVAEVSTNDDAIDKNWLSPLLERQDFQASEGMWWRGAICDGDAYVMVDPVTLLWSSEPAFDGFSGVTAIFNQMTRRPVWACKMWSESDSSDKDDESGGPGKPSLMKLVVYQPKRITYWQGQEGTAAVEPAKEGDKERPWPAEFEGALPFVTFANQRNNFTRYGQSELRKAIPLQDVLNRTVYSMVMASEFAAFPVNWSKGMAIDPGGVLPGSVINLVLQGADGKPITEFSAEQIAFLSASQVGQLQAANLSQYTGQIELIVREISQATQTPIYGITNTGAVSGDALKQLEIGLIGKCIRFQRQNRDALAELIRLTAKMERVFSPGKGTPEIKEVAITWKSPEILDNNLQITALVTMRAQAPGLWADAFYQMKIGQLLGMTKPDIQQEIEAAKKEKEEKLKEMAAMQPPSMFGNGGGSRPPGQQPGQPGNGNGQKPVQQGAKPLQATR